MPAALRVPWVARVSVGFGIIVRPFHGHRLDPGVLATTLALQAGALVLGHRVGDARAWAWRGAGALVGAAGLAMLVAA